MQLTLTAGLALTSTNTLPNTQNRLCSAIEHKPGYAVVRGNALEVNLPFAI